MRRYVSKPTRSAAGDDYWYRQSGDHWYAADNGPQTITVHEDGCDTFSGLYDAEGNELHRERPRMGFRIGND